MKVIERRETWIHTHFLTDCVRLPSHRMAEIKREMEPLLRSLGIVYGIHFEEHRTEKGIRIVLECIPFTSTMVVIEQKLKETIKDIPSKPQPVRARPLELADEGQVKGKSPSLKKEIGKATGGITL